MTVPPHLITDHWSLSYLVSGAVVLNLEGEEFVNGFDRLRVHGSDADLAAFLRLFVGVCDRVVLRFHDRHAGRHAVVDEHGNVEIAGGEESGNVRQMGPNLIAGGVVMLALDFHADGPAVRQQDEMMRGGLMGETHAMIAP